MNNKIIIVISVIITTMVLAVISRQSRVRGLAEVQSNPIKTVVTGNYKNRSQLINAINTSNIHVVPEAMQILRKIPISTTQGSATLVLTNLSDLGFTDPAGYEEIFARASSYGLSLVTPEVAVPLLLQFPEQKVGEFTYLGMLPVTDDAGNPHILYIENRGDLRWLDIDNGDLPHKWDVDSKWVFIKK